LQKPAHELLNTLQKRKAALISNKKDLKVLLQKLE
jgi:hypothetical protein